MSISLKKVSKTYDTTVVLSSVTIALNPGERIALVGENGAGKTTILKMCAGLEDVTSGQIFLDPHERACYVSQEFPVEEFDGISGLEYVFQHGGDSLFRGVSRILSEFDFKKETLDLPLKVMSGGQQKILNLAVSLAQRPRYLLVDEPENHLDIFARQTLISLLKEYRGCVVFVSHDQELINSVTNRIVEVHDGTLSSYTGSYEFYLEQKARMDEGKARSWKGHEKKVNQLDQLIKRMREWVKKNPDLGPQLRARKSQMERLQRDAPEKPKAQRKAKITIADTGRGSKRILLAEDLSIRLGESTIIKKTGFVINSGEKVAIVGRNGSGKSTFLKAVIGKVGVTSGRLKVAESLQFGYFSQDALAVLDPSKTPLDAVSAVAGHLNEQGQRSMLARYLIGPDICTRKIETLSGGQKTRLRFCLMFVAKNELLILDEPTNHLDPVTWEILAEALKEYTGTVIMVSHDRMFIDQTTTRLFVVENQVISEYYGTLNEYLTE